jgi:uncharacterized protein YggE
VTSRYFTESPDALAGALAGVLAEVADAGAGLPAVATGRASVAGAGDTSALPAGVFCASGVFEQATASDRAVATIAKRFMEYLFELRNCNRRTGPNP